MNICIILISGILYIRKTRLKKFGFKDKKGYFLGKFNESDQNMRGWAETNSSGSVLRTADEVLKELALKRDDEEVMTSRENKELNELLYLLENGIPVDGGHPGMANLTHEQ